MSLEAYYAYMFAMIHTHKWNLRDLENMLPWERDIYLMKMDEWIKEENRKTDEHNRKMKT